MGETRDFRGYLKSNYPALSLILLFAAAVAAAVWWPDKPSDSAAGNEIWTCSMHPEIRLPGPGRCPKCEMPLIPLSKLPSAGKEIEAQAGVATAPVIYRELFKEIRTVGKLDYNESRIAYITARVPGRIDRVHADFTGVQVRRHDHLVDIYSPALYLAQNELFRSLESLDKGTGDRAFSETNADAARTKLKLLGLLDEQIQEIEESRKPKTHLTLFAPIGGTVIEKNIRKGQYVKEGDLLYRIAELDPIWLYLDIYEYDVAWIAPGQETEVAVEAYPGEAFHGKVVFVDPFVNDATRTVKVRVNLKNPDHRLKPAMYGSATIRVRLRSDGTPEPTGIEGKYICPMHPEIMSDEKGTCSLCEMPLELVPPHEHKIEKAPAAVNDKVNDKAPVKNGRKRTAKGEAAKDKNKPAIAPDFALLAIPVGAVLDTGTRRVTYVKKQEGEFELRELRLGPKATALNDRGQREFFYPVFKGLSEGERVVVRGGFLIDSQRQIEGTSSLFYPQGNAPAAGHAGHAAPDEHDGHSTPNKKVDYKKHTDHEEHDMPEESMDDSDTAKKSEE